MMIIFIMLGYIDENSCLSTVGPFDNLVYEFCVLKHLTHIQYLAKFSISYCHLWWTDH